MATKNPRRSQRKEAEAFQPFPPEGVREPFKSIPIQWSQRFPMGTGGMNVAVAPDMLAQDEALFLENQKIADFGIRGVYGTNRIGTGGPSATIRGIINYEPVSDTQPTLSFPSRLVVCDGTQLWAWNGTTWGSAITGGMTDSGFPVSMAMILNKLVFTNFGGEPRVWTGGATYAALSADANRPLKARYVVGFANRAVFAVVGDGTELNYSRLEWSANGDATDYTSTGAGGVTLQDLQPGFPLDKITGLTAVGKYLLVVREHSIWIGTETGVATAPFKFIKAVQGPGCRAPYSVVNIGHDQISFIGDHNIYIYSLEDNETIPIGTKIWNDFFTGITSVNDYRFFGARVNTKEGEELWYFATNDGIDYPERAYIFDLDRFRRDGTMAWSKRTFPYEVSWANSAISPFPAAWIDERLILGRDDGQVWHSDWNDHDDDLTNISATYTSPQFTLGPHLVKLLRINVAYSSIGTNISVTPNVSIDGGLNWTSLGASTFAASSAVIEKSLFVPATVPLAESVMFRLTFDSDLNFRLYGYRIGFQPRGQILGYTHAV